MTISSMGGLDDDDASSPPHPQIGTRELLIVVIQTIVRLGLGFAFILWMMSLAPKTSEDSVLYPAFLAVAGITVYIIFFRRQLKGVYKARYPTLRAIEALILTASMFLAIFAMTYVEISLQTTGSFTEDLDSFSAYYYALTVLATVGFGDIAPTSVPARAVTMVQMSLDIAFIAVLIRVMGGAAKKALLQRAQHEQHDSAPTSTEAP
jgi:voltage-gated potassium channel